MRVIALCAFLAAGCVDTGTGAADAGGIPACTMTLAGQSPLLPKVGDMVVIMARIDTNTPGLQAYIWSVNDPGGAPVAFEPQGTSDAREIFFTALVPGSYQISLMGSVGSLVCTAAVGTADVTSTSNAAGADGDES